MKTISEVNRIDCCGCELCAEVCPKDAIDFVEDKYFYYPQINTGKCIRCGKCFALCPLTSNLALKEIDKAYITLSKDTDIYNKSTSGGFFGAVAKVFVKDRKGVAVGAAVDETGNVRHIAVEKAADIEKLQGSKYVQCAMGDIYKEIDKYLKQGRQVVFGATPCQVAATRQRFGNNQNLYLIDLVCYGVPSPILLKEDISRLLPEDEKIEKIIFRTKNKQEKYGYNLKILGKTKKVFLKSEEDAFYKLYMEDAILRESCYNCRYSCKHRAGDITIGDCINDTEYLNFSGDKIVSTIYPVTDKGKALFEEIKDKFYFQEVDAAFESNANIALNHPAARPEIRDTILNQKVDLDAVVRVNPSCVQERKTDNRTLRKLFQKIKR